MMNADEILGVLELGGVSRRVLVVEDQLGWLLRLTDFLESRGHLVTPVVGVLEVNAELVVAIGVDGTVMEPAMRTTEIEAVFLDYNFVGGKHNGASFLREFRQLSDAPVMGMSSDVGLNYQLTALGATLTMQKTRLKGVLRN